MGAMSVARVFRTDRETFDRWAQALPGLPLPSEMTSGDAGGGLVIDVSAGPGPVAVPPEVAASLAVHGCAEVAVVVRVEASAGPTLAVFGALGSLAAGLVRGPSQVEIGLFELSDLVDRVIDLVPAVPVAGVTEVPHEGVTDSSCSVRIAVMGADAAVAGWEQAWFGPLTRAGRHEMAVELRLALARAWGEP
jgi:hypothetical protein